MRSQDSHTPMACVPPVSIMLCTSTIYNLVLYIQNKSTTTPSRLSASLNDRFRLFESRFEYSHSPLVSCEQDAAAEDCATKPHTRASPKAFDTIVCDDTPECFHCARSRTALTACLDSVEWLSSQSRDDTRHATVCEVGGSRLRNFFPGFVVFQDVVGAHTNSTGACLLQGRPCESTVQTENAVLFPDCRHCMRRAPKPSLVSRIVNQGGLHALCRRYCEETCDDTAHHAGAQTSERCQGTGFGILEPVFDIVEAEKANAIFGNTADCKGGAAFVQGFQPFLLVYSCDDNEWVLWCWHAFLFAQLYARLCKLEWILRIFSRCMIQDNYVCGKLTVAVASMAPAIPPARSDTTAGVEESYGHMSMA
jgi:hypothetical protein